VWRLKVGIALLALLTITPPSLALLCHWQRQASGFIPSFMTKTKNHPLGELCVLVDESE
jgi:hypothetical protein